MNQALQPSDLGFGILVFLFLFPFALAMLMLVVTMWWELRWSTSACTTKCTTTDIAAIAGIVVPAYLFKLVFTDVRTSGFLDAFAGGLAVHLATSSLFYFFLPFGCKDCGTLSFRHNWGLPKADCARCRGSGQFFQSNEPYSSGGWLPCSCRFWACKSCAISAERKMSQNT